jgi:hypothetical protein
MQVEIASCNPLYPHLETGFKPFLFLFHKKVCDHKTSSSTLTRTKKTENKRGFVASQTNNLLKKDMLPHSFAYTIFQLCNDVMHYDKK